MGLTKGQQLCVDTLDKPLVVAAGAGSGKTFTLTKRIVNAIERGYVSDIGEVCAITFTNKAAGELKSRIKAELRACGRIDQALKVDEAWVSTIHGMCARILRAHAIELGIDPAFKVGEGAQVRTYLARAVDEVLYEAQASANSPQLDALFREYPSRSSGFGASVESMLLNLVDEASSRAEGTAAFVLPGVTANPAIAVESAVEVVEGVLIAAAGEKESPKRDEWIAATERLLDSARAELASGIEDNARALALLAPIKLAKTFGSKAFKAQVDEARGALGSFTMEIRLGAARPHLETLVKLADRALAEFNRLKRADGVLDNNDLLVLAARAIEEHPSIAARYTDKFKLVMVDEFQDTDQMQVDMIKRLSGEGACRLCTVGDAQQSIYRFRGADVSVYRRHLGSLSESWPDSIIRLSDNFRSHYDVLAFVDRVFEKPDMFGGEFMSLRAGREEERVAAPFSDSEPRIVVQHQSRPWRGVDASDACEVAARRIARKFAQYRRDGHGAGEMVILLGRMTNAAVYAQALRDEGLPCVISGGSVFAGTPEALVMRELVRSLANPRETQSLFNVLTSPMFGLTAADLLAVGDLGGFSRAALGGGAAESKETRFYLETSVGARFIAPASCGNGLDKSSPYGNLSTTTCFPNAAHSEPDFERCDSAESNRSEDSANPIYSPRLACALRIMGDAWRRVGDEPLSRIIGRLLADSGWLTRLEHLGPEGLASAGNLHKAIRMLAGVERSDTFGPLSVMRRFENTLDSSKEAPGALSVSGGDSVRIMTIHASKGLEFPIVAVAEIKENRPPSSKLLCASVGGKAYLSLDLGRTIERVSDSVNSDMLSQMRDYVLGLVAGEDELAGVVAQDSGALHRRLAIREFIAAGDEEEAKRLLYVALTRAKEALVVSSLGTSGKTNPLGVPKSALAGVFSALDPADEGFIEGENVRDFGGKMPAVFDYVALSPGEMPFASEAQQKVEESLFMVPAPEPLSGITREPYRPAHEGVFSYSSIADSFHEGDVLARLAEAYTVSVDSPEVPPAARESAFDESGAAETQSSASVFTATSTSRTSFGDNESDYDFDVSAAFDEDRATDLGTAFHRLAQYAVVAREASGLLVRPPADRIEVLSRTCNLDGTQRFRLSAALDSWFASDLAHEVAALPGLAAEVPFFVSVPGDEARYLEGEIDLLGFDAARSHAFVVDYKTGGSPDETADDLRRKHVLQAACYAYAILLQGVEQVDAAFVRVEQGCQCVRYHFEASDLPALAAAIGR